MEQAVKTMRRILMVIGTLFMAQVVMAVFMVLVGVFQGLFGESWGLFWGWALPSFRDAVVCFTLAWIVGRLGQGGEETAEEKKEEEREA